MSRKKYPQVRIVTVPSSEEAVAGAAIEAIIRGGSPNKAISRVVGAGKCAKCRTQLHVKESPWDPQVACPDCRGRGKRRSLLGLRNTICNSCFGRGMVVKMLLYCERCEEHQIEYVSPVQQAN